MKFQDMEGKKGKEEERDGGGREIDRGAPFL